MKLRHPFLVLVVTLSCLALATGWARAEPAAITAKQHLDAASAAEKTKDFASAAREARAAYALEPSAAAVQTTARAEEALDHPLAAMDAYDQLLSEFGTTLPVATKLLATTRLAALAPKIGTIAASVTPVGSTIVVDGAERGRAPLAKPLRVIPGNHRIGAKKAGFLANEIAVDVAAGTEVTAELALAPEPTSGHVSIREAEGRALVVSIDGRESGPLPWAGELGAGPHDVTARNETLFAPKQTITVENGKSLDVMLEAEPRTGRLDLHTIDGKGLIFMDRATLGEGHATGAAPVGPHKFSILRDGYQRLDIDHVIIEDETWSLTVTLQPHASEPAETASKSDERGVVGEVRFNLVTQVGSAGSESESNCHSLGGNCVARTPIGGGLLFAVGYMVKHFGGDLYFGPMLDNATRHYTDLHGESQSYSVARAGGVQALRARGSIQNERFRGTAALGPGLAERVVGIAKDFPSLPKDVQTYISFGFTLDLNGQLRIGSSTALTLGMTLWIESAGNGVVTEKAPTSGSFHLVAGAQTFFMPYLGFQFGP